MSNALAIASVSAVLKDLLNNAAIDHQLSNVVGEVKVSALPPDRVLVEGTPETSRINLFMYQVTPNQGWRNVDLRAGTAAASGQPARRWPSTSTTWCRPTVRASSMPRSCSATPTAAPRDAGAHPRRHPADPRPSLAGHLGPAAAAGHTDGIRARRPGRADPGDARDDEPRGDLAAVGGHPVPLPARRPRTRRRWCSSSRAGRCAVSAARRP